MTNDRSGKPSDNGPGGTRLTRPSSLAALAAWTREAQEWQRSSGERLGWFVGYHTGRLVGTILVRAEKVSTGIVSLAGLIAGPRHSWAREAWRADLRHGVDGEGRPFSSWQKFHFALSTLVIAAPRLRLSSLSKMAVRLFAAVWTTAVRITNTCIDSDVVASTIGTGTLLLKALRWARRRQSSHKREDKP